VYNKSNVKKLSCSLKMAWHELMDHFCNNIFLLVYFYDYLFSEIKKDTGDSMWLN